MRRSLRNKNAGIVVTFNAVPADVARLIFDFTCARTLELRYFSLVSMEMSRVVALINARRALGFLL